MFVKTPLSTQIPVLRATFTKQSKQLPGHSLQICNADNSNFFHLQPQKFKKKKNQKTENKILIALMKQKGQKGYYLVHYCSLVLAQYSSPNTRLYCYIVHHSGPQFSHLENEIVVVDYWRNGVQSVLHMDSFSIQYSRLALIYIIFLHFKVKFPLRHFMI